MISFIKPLVFLYFSILSPFVESVIITGSVPKSLWGKKVFLNGPQKSNEFNSIIDGPGHITCVNLLDDGTIIVSEDFIKPSNFGLNIRDIFKKDFPAIINKFFNEPNFLSTGFCNTAVRYYLGKYYAVEETSRPIEIIFDKYGKIKCNGDSLDIDRMAAHLINNYTRFSYTPDLYAPLKYNNTIINWFPERKPLVIHEGRISECGNYMIFPLTSVGFGNVIHWILNVDILPFSTKSNTFKWLLIDLKKNKCLELDSNEYIDVNHIYKVEQLENNNLVIYISHFYDFWKAMYNNVPFDLKLFKHTIDLDKKRIISIEDTNSVLDLAYAYGDEIIGNGDNNSSKVTIYNTITGVTKKKCIPGGDIYEIIPYENNLLYYSHENTKTFLYIINKDTCDIITKIEVPYRELGIHTSLLD